MALDNKNLLTLTWTRGVTQHGVEMTHLPTGQMVRLADEVGKVSLATLISRARRLLEREVKHSETPNNDET